MSNLETPAVTLAPSPDPSHVVEHFLHDDVLPQAEATVVSMLVTEPAVPSKTVPAVAEPLKVKAVPPRCKIPVHGEVK